MVHKKRRTPKSADVPLTRDLTESFIQRLNSILNEWPADPRVQILRHHWQSKFVEIDAGSAAVRRSKAVTKWLMTESTNTRTNERLLSGADQFVWYGDVTFSRVLLHARRFIESVIGDTPSLDILNGGFSGGASTSRSRSEGHPALKFLDKADATRQALQLFYDLNRGTLWDYHFNASVETSIVAGNVMFTVPKTSEIDRVACKEPDINLFLQKAIGNQIRWALRRRGINLNDQGINGELARIGSIDGSLMTLDLSSASDSVTIELVRRLMPPNWFAFMETVRSPYTSIDGATHCNAMFSSMGNGFTFELESLIFLALTRAVTYSLGIRGKVSVYGDDIIAPSEAYEPLVSLLSFAGFTVNESKSFHEGPFRESCGRFWHAGIDAKPFFLRKAWTRLSDMILTLNQLAEWSTVEHGVFDPRFYELWLDFVKMVPPNLYGGQDFSSRTSLVTGHSPRKELIAVTRQRDEDHVGGYLLWLLVTANRVGITSHIDITSSSVAGLYRLRKSRQGRRTDLPYLLAWEDRLVITRCVNVDGPA